MNNQALLSPMLHQLSVPPSRVLVPDSMLFRGLYGNVVERQFVAALIIKMCQEAGDVWRGWTVGAMVHKARSYCGTQGVATFSAGLDAAVADGLRQHHSAGTIYGTPHARIFYPTDALLEPLRGRYFR